MINKIKRQDCLKAYSKFPQCFPEKDDFFYPKISQSYTLTLSSKTINVHVRKLSKELVDLIQLLRFDCLIFLGDYKTPWLYQDNNYKPVERAIEYLKEKKVGRRFNGGFEVNLADLYEFSIHLFWLSRCNASLPLIYFMDKKQNILGSVCKYGNVHLETFNKKTDKIFQSVLNNTGFSILDGKCYELFSKTGAIKGRRIVI